MRVWLVAATLWALGCNSKQSAPDPAVQKSATQARRAVVVGQQSELGELLTAIVVPFAAP